MSEWHTLEEIYARMSWRQKLRVWWERIKLRRAIRRGWRPTVHTLCFGCLHPIEDGDEACVCIQCGGMNRRIRS